VRGEIIERERECFDFLKSIPLKRKFVVVEGYAVSSFRFPRFSVDLDIVIPEEELKFFRALIKKQGFVLIDEKSDFDLTYGGRFEKYRRGEPPISVDLLINSVQARQTNYSYSFEYIFKNSELREIRGWHADLKLETMVADREMLIALKVNSMRAADKRDILMLCYEKPDIGRIVKHLQECPREIIHKHVEGLMRLLEDPKQVDSIKGVFSISTAVMEKARKNCLEVLNVLMRRLYG
jgi:hypothetical protein